MTIYSKFNIVYRLQKWIDSVPGQTFLNYAYSWGASIVILGTLFKLTHLAGANFFLFLGMGTEVFVFFISAFDRPFDKTADGMDLPTHVGMVAGGQVPEGNLENSDMPELQGQQGTVSTGGVAGGGTIIIGGGVVGGGVVGGMAGGQPAAETVAATTEAVNTEAIAAVSSSVSTMAGGNVASPVPSVNPELEEATSNYVDELKRLTEMLQKVSVQSERLTRDSEEMENLNRTLTGICKVYEMQLKGASQQIGTIDEINEQTRKMADQIVELNKIYARMIEAMTVNMPKVAKSEE
ncbi:MAG: gliding motility protein GldL [Prevotella sp.]|nr:gliding motility protein GldL [Prevotella sp.]